MSNSLDIVIPVFNGAEWITKTIDRTTAALNASDWAGTDIIVVDDGSTDRTGPILDELARTRPELKVVHTPNQGRFLARKTGIEAAAADSILLVDTRVFLDESSLAFVHRRMAEDPDALIWNGHVEIDTSENSYARFWQAITFVAWRRYLADPRPVSFGPDDFDHYPKGTGCFLAPRAALIDAYRVFSSHYDDLRRVNDDTSLIRSLAEQSPIHIDPGFSCVYHARGDLKGFLTHAFYRGMHFVDGYLRPGNRFFLPLLGILGATPLGAAALALWPIATVLSGLAGLTAVALTLLVLGVPWRTVAWFVALLPAFTVVYAAGIWRGVALLVRTRRARGSS